MRIELYGIARTRAGRDWVEVEAGTLGEALRGLVASCPGLEPEVIAGVRLADGFLASLNGERFLLDAGSTLGAGDTLLIVAADAGG